MQKHLTAISLIVTLSVTANCRDSRSPTMPESPSSPSEWPRDSQPTDLLLSLSGEARGTLDYEYARIAAEEVQGFGGYFLDRQAIPSVYLKDSSYRTAAAEALGRFFDRSTAKATQRPDLATIRVLPGQYDFAELFAWLEPLQNVVFRIEGTQSTDIDESRNRLVVGVLDEQARARVVSAVAKLRIPRNAVIVEIEPRFYLSSDSLTGKVRPIKGGLGIQSSRVGDNLCTLGFLIKTGTAAFPSTL